MPSANDGNETRRRLMHTRSVECEGFLRDDGLWEVEAWLRDTKPFTQCADRFRGELKPGDPVHDIGLRLAIDDDMTTSHPGRPVEQVLQLAYAVLVKMAAASFVASGLQRRSVRAATAPPIDPATHELSPN